MEQAIERKPINVKESRKDIDKLRNIISRLFYLKCAYLGELKKLDGKAKESVLHDLRGHKFHDVYASRVFDEVDTSYRHRFHEVDNYLNALTERLTTYTMKIAVKILAEAFKLLASLEKKYQRDEDVLAPISEHKKSLNELARSVVNHYKEHLRYEFKDRYLVAETKEEKNKLIRETILTQTTLINSWERLLSEENKYINFERDFHKMDFSQMDLTGLDLRRAIFVGCGFGEANLGGAQCEPQQFLHARDFDTVHADSKLLDDVKSQKNSKIESARRDIQESILKRQEYLNMLKLLPLLEYRGEAPELEDALTESVLRVAMGLFVRASNINMLPDEDEYSLGRINPDEVDFSTKTRAELFEIYDRIVNARGKQLSQEVLLHTMHQYMVIIYQYIDDDYTKLELLESLISGLPKELREENEQFISETRKFLRELKSNKKKQERKYNQDLINSFIDRLHQEPDPCLGFTPSARLKMVLDSARNHDDLVVDLTNAELTKEVLEGSQEKIDFSFVHVVLSRTQEAALSWKYRHQRYARLYQAIDNEDLGEIAMCCKQGLSVNWYNEGGRTPFMKACIEGRTAAVGFMLKHCKPLINLKSKSPNEDAGQWTALEAVLMIDDYSMAELLLKNGAEFSFIAAVVMNKVSEYEGDKSVHVINTPCLGGKLPLFVAIRRKFPDLVLWFLNNGANISFSEGQKTALKEAVLSGNLEIVSLIHKRGGVITPELIRLACDKEFVEIAHYLYANVEQPNKIDLYSACFLKKIPQNEIDALIQGDCKTAQPDGMLPLATACLAGNVETARVFLRRGADLYMPSKRRTFPGGAELPLFYAVSRRRTEVVRYLVDEEGVSPTCIIQGSTPPFIEAVRNNSSEIMEIMLRKNNINLNAQDSEGKTALLVAVHNGATGVVKLLLERGVSPYIADNTGNLPLHYAYSEGYLEIVALLQEAMLHPKNKTGKTPKEIAKKIPEPKKSTFVLVMDSEEPHIQENITQCKGYICHEVLGDGECGYRAFGIERDKAYDLMMDVEQFDERVFYLLQPGIIEALRTEAFYEYLLVNNNKITTEGITFQQIVDSIEDYAGDADIILSYIDYDVRDGLIDSGWAHPSTLQALAHIQGIELHIWRLDAEEKLIPHEYAEYIPEDVVNPQRTDLLFVNGNHFNRIELTQRAEVRPASPREHFGSQQAFLAPPSPSQQSNVREKGEEEARVAQLDK